MSSFHNYLTMAMRMETYFGVGEGEQRGMGVESQCGVAERAYCLEPQVD